MSKGTADRMSKLLSSSISTEDFIKQMKKGSIRDAMVRCSYRRPRNPKISARAPMRVRASGFLRNAKVSACASVRVGTCSLSD